MKLWIDDSAFNADETQLVEVASFFAADRLEIPKHARVLVYRTAMHGTRDKWGECEMLTPRLFVVKITPKCARSMRALEYSGLLIFFHELTHVAQGALGRLTYTRTLHRPRFHGELIDGYDYEKDPSEQEAWRKGRELARLFLPHYKKAVA
jgi:hypothetical protein